MILNPTCIACIVKRQEESIAAETDEAKKLAYIKEVLKILYDNADSESAPVTTELISAARKRYFGEDQNFESLKQKYNDIMLRYENRIEESILISDDPLAAAMKFARAGNYIDFGAMGDIDDNKLNELLQNALKETLDAETCARFLPELQKARRIAYLTDNCGEIVMDKLFIRALKRQRPGLHIDVIVRGKPVLNDATRKDAEQAGIGKEAHIIENGSGAAGTDLQRISAEAKDALSRADFILSKGQGNFESLHGCGLNIYYLFLCKCDWFTRRFGLERFKGVFVHEASQRIQ